MKSEPDEFSLDDLRASHGGVAQWDGVRNAQARNLMKTMRVGDRAFFYHSSCKVPAVVGICEVVKAAYPDPTALDPKAQGFDPKSTPTNNRWLCVDVEFIRAMSRTVTLSELRREAAGDGVTGEDGAKALASMTLSKPTEALGAARDSRRVGTRAPPGDDVERLITVIAISYRLATR